MESTNWISVETLPPPSKQNKNFSDTVLLLVGKRKYKGCYSYHFREFYRDGFHVENHTFNKKYVTHWMPLPEPPKVK